MSRPWRAFLRVLQIGSALLLVLGATAIQFPADAQIELPTSTTLIATTLPTVSLTTTTLTETTLSSLATPTTEAISNVISTVDDTTGTTLALIDDSIEETVTEEPSVSGALSPLLQDTCTEGSSLIESELLDCESQMSTSTRDPAGFGALPSGVVPLFGDDEVPGDPTGEQEGDEEEEAESSPEPAPDSGDEESPPTLTDRLLDQIEKLLQLIKTFDVEVAGIQLLSTTGLAVTLLAAVGTGLLLAGLGVLKLGDWSRRDD